MATNILGGERIYIVANLPTNAKPGDRAFVSDALTPAFNAAVAGGGAVFVPVFFNNSAWFVG